MMKRLPAILLLIIGLLGASASHLHAQSVPSLTLISWNIQSSASDPATIETQMALFDDVDIWLLQEVNGKEAAYYERGAERDEEADFTFSMSTSGDGNNLLTLWDAERFTLLESEQLNQINTTGNARPALVVHLHDNATGTDFLVINNHLYSSRPGERERQASLLAEWAREQSLPILAGGDFNFEARWSDVGYFNIKRYNLWQWVEPETPGASLPNGMLVDHFFLVGDAQGWPATAHVVTREGDADSIFNADHKPIMALVGPDAIAYAPPCSVTEKICGVDPTAITTGESNLRSGPGTAWPVVGKTARGEALAIEGVSADGKWYALADETWISTLYVVGAPALATLALIDTPALPALPTPAVAQRSSPTGNLLPPTVPESRPVALGGDGTGSGDRLVIVTVDKRAEYAVIRNDGSAAVDLRGWTLRSERGTQDCLLAGIIEPGASLTISALGTVAGFDCGFANNIWNNSEPDPASLISPGGAVVTTYPDGTGAREAPQVEAAASAQTGDAPARQGGSALVIVALDKREEYAVIRNDGAEAINLQGWTLRSERGTQDCRLSGVLEAGASLTISAMGTVPGFDCGFGSNIWNNSEYDPALLLAPDGAVVSTYH
jgi:endonuclease/exonuclease/phosphatase family metal-dependent hydrolase